jgi:hypothetical protein
MSKQSFVPVYQVWFVIIDNIFMLVYEVWCNV